MANLTKAPQKTNTDLLMLLVSANFDRSRIVIAEHEFSQQFLTLYIEDKEDFKEHIEDTLMFKLPISKFAEIIEAEEYNSYQGVMYSEHNRPYDTRILINEPIKWYHEDATLYQQKCVLESVLERILKALVKGNR